MKNITYIIVILILTLLGCSKEKAIEQPVSDEIKLITLNTTDRDAITMLEFSSIEAYEGTIAQLEDQLESLDDAFVATYSSLNDDQLNAKVEEVGFEYQQPLIDFESTYNITNSLRDAYNVANEDWLNNVTLDPATDPIKTFVFRLAEMTLLNANGEVKIGDFILKLTKDGFIQITDASINTLVRIDNGDLAALYESNVVTNIIEGSRDSDDCSWWKEKVDYHEYVTGSKKVRKYVHFHAYPWKGDAESHLTSYTKSGNKWKEYKMDLCVANQAYWMNRDCVYITSQWSGNKCKRTKSISKGNTRWGAFPGIRATKVTNYIFGQYQYAGYTTYLNLIW